MVPAIEQRFGCGGTGRRGVFGKELRWYGTITHTLRRSDIWGAATFHSGDTRCAICRYATGPAHTRWRRELDKVINPLATASIYDPDPTQFLGIRLPVTFDTCEIIEERWANWLNEHGISANTRFEACIAKDYPETGFDLAAFFGIAGHGPRLSSPEPTGAGQAALRCQPLTGV